MLVKYLHVGLSPPLQCYIETMMHLMGSAPGRLPVLSPSTCLGLPGRVYTISAQCNMLWLACDTYVTKMENATSFANPAVTGFDSVTTAPLDLGTQLDQLLAEVLLLGLVLAEVVPHRGAALRQRRHQDRYRHPFRWAEIRILLGTCRRQY